MAHASVQTDSPFTAFGTDGPGTSALNSVSSVLASMSSQFDETRTAGTPATTAAASSEAAITASSGTVAVASSRISGTAATTLSTVPSSNASSSGTRATGAGATTKTSSGTSNSASSVAQSTAGANVGDLTQQQSCDSISCSAGLKAAVAVPVVVGVLGIIAFAAFFIRRRKRKARSEAQGMGKPKSSKKWTRHLRVFSFDAELLMGGRFSSTNSLRSGRSSVRVNTQSPVGHQPSIHSVDEVAPPYRDAVSHAQPPNMAQVGPGILAAGAIADPVARPASSATAPPPYGSVSRQSNRPATATSSRHNPFSDSTSASPVEGSPFNDPPEADGQSTHTRSTMSRNSSMYHGHGADDTSTLAGSDAASIHEATVGRHISVSSAGRAIENIRSSQHRGTPSP